MVRLHPGGRVDFDTTHGRISIGLFTKEAPMACRHFIQLVQEGFYDGCRFHNVVPDVLVQCGLWEETGQPVCAFDEKGHVVQPSSMISEQKGDSDEPLDMFPCVTGKPFALETHPKLSLYGRGLLCCTRTLDHVRTAGGRSRAGHDQTAGIDTLVCQEPPFPDSGCNTSEFFITVQPIQHAPHRRITIFGVVLEDTIFNLQAIGGVTAHGGGVGEKMRSKGAGSEESISSNDGTGSTNGAHSRAVILRGRVRAHPFEVTGPFGVVPRTAVPWSPAGRKRAVAWQTAIEDGSMAARANKVRVLDRLREAKVRTAELDAAGGLSFDGQGHGGDHDPCEDGVESAGQSLPKRGRRRRGLVLQGSVGTGSGEAAAVATIKDEAESHGVGGRRKKRRRKRSETETGVDISVPRVVGAGSQDDGGEAKGEEQPVVAHPTKAADMVADEHVHSSVDVVAANPRDGAMATMGAGGGAPVSDAALSLMSLMSTVRKGHTGTSWLK